MFRKVWNLLPAKDRKTCIWVGLAVFVRALLDFASIAALLPILVILLGDDPDKSKALLLCGAVLAFILLKNGLSIILTRFQSKFLLRLYKYFSHKLFFNYYHRGLLFLKSKSTAQLASEVNFICYAFSLNILNQGIQLLGAMCLVVLMVGALLWWAPLAGVLMCAGFLPIVAFYLLFVKKRTRRFGEEEIEARRAQARTVNETFRGFAELEVSGAYHQLEEAFLHGLDTINQCRLRMELVHAVPPMLSEAAIVLGIALLLVFGQGDLRIMSGVFAIAAFRLIPAVRSIMSCWTVMRTYSHCVDIIADGIKDEATLQQNQQNIQFNKEIKVTELNFTFPDGGQILNHFSLTINKGECLGIKGPSGSGKSTLFNLLLGFYPATSGAITIDGEQLQPSNLQAWHRLVGYVPQEIFIMKGDLAQNIALGQTDIDEERLLQVLEQVCLKEWVDTLPEGIHTPLGEFGSRLSGGQKQRIGIARALYKQAEILFFDEATSSLDNQTEMEVNQAIMDLSAHHQELTMVIIAHRESSLTCCHRVVSL